MVSGTVVAQTIQLMLNAIDSLVLMSNLSVVLGGVGAESSRLAMLLVLDTNLLVKNVVLGTLPMDDIMVVL